VARLLAPLQRLCRKETIWQPTEVIGTEVVQVWHQEHGWQKPRRLILIRHKVADKKRPGGKKLLEVEGYTFQALVTNLPETVPALPTTVATTLAVGLPALAAMSSTALALLRSRKE
jgi:hypothetical protein